MSSLFNHEKNDMQPPTKRQRILPEGTSASSASTPSRVMSPPCLGKAIDISSSSEVNIRHPTDGGPIFTDVQEISGCSSIESALGVPTRILFRQVGGDRKEPEGTSKSNTNIGKESRRRLRPLLSRQEAEQFLRITLLAQEIDVLVDLSETVLSRRQFARRFRRDVLMQRGADFPTLKDRPWKNPWLSTLGPILDVLENRQSNPSKEYQFISNQQQNPQEHVLHHIHNELTRLYHALQTCGVYELERSAEQNRSLVASLTDILGYNLDNDGQDDDHSGRTSAVRNLAREKESLSKLQKLLAKRVRSLLVVLCHSQSATTTESNDTNDDGAKIDFNVNNGNVNDDDTKQILFDEQLPPTSTDVNAENDGDNEVQSPKKKASNEEDNDDESSILSLEEILTPLEAVCERLFDRSDRETTAPIISNIESENDCVGDDCYEKLQNNKISGCPEPTKKEKQQQIQQEKMGLDRTNNDSFLLKAASSVSVSAMMTGSESAPGSTVEEPDPMTRISLEATQRTVGAAATIMTLAGKAEEDFPEHEEATIQLISGEEIREPTTMMNVEVEASQRAVGAAATMMALGTTTGPDFTTHKHFKTKRDSIHKNKNGSNSKPDTGDNGSHNHPHTQQHTLNEDDSFVDDPPSDREDGYDETTNKDESTGCKDTQSSMGIFDLVDVLTPQSQS